MLWIYEVPLDDKTERVAYFASKPKTLRNKNPVKFEAKSLLVLRRFHEGDTTFAILSTTHKPFSLLLQNKDAIRFSQ